MHLVLCPDENYADHAAVMLASVFANISKPRSLKVWVVANGLAARSRRLLARVVRRGRGQIGFLTIDAAPLKDAPCDGHITLASYYRLLAPLYLPEEVDRFLYLDSDVVVEDDIASLFAVDLAGNVLAAVGNPCGWRAEIGLPPETRYFNAGVMMVDHRRWQAERVSERVIEVIAEKAGVLRYWDQDALNCVIAGRWTVLEPLWNQQHYFRNMAPGVIGYGPEQWKRALEQPSLIHFTGDSKPWHVKNRHPFRSRYHHYRRRAGLLPLWLRPKHLVETLRRAFYEKVVKRIGR